MATRRPRIKAAAILKPRRVVHSTSSTSDHCAANTDTVKSELRIESKSDISKIDTPSATKRTEPTTPTISRLRPSDIQSVSAFAAKAATAYNEQQPPQQKQSNDFDEINDDDDDDDDDDDAMPFKSPTPNSEYDSNVSKAPRRLSIPTVNMVMRRKNSENRSSIGMSTPNHHLKSPSYQPSFNAREPIIRPIASPLPGCNTPKTPTIVDDDVFSPIPAEGDFKSPPFMSPSIYTRRADPSMSPFHDAYNDDYTKSPSSVASSKVRQRIRPTPCFASRRNSVNCSAASDVEDDQNRRQRHYSTSSAHNNYIAAMTPQHTRTFPSLGKQIGRVRTESYSSTVSDAPYSRDLNSAKLKRSHRSEEYQRVANAKREFNHRLNGKPPDKSRLTMYDLIYYNPLTNPMSKPAGKGDKSSDTASVSSTRTNQSRSSGSVKSEASSHSGPVKAEHSSTGDPVTEPMPVPQLKLGANGEIVLDEKSLVIETTTDKEAREILANTEVVYDDEFTGTSGFYKRQKRTRDWLPLETIKFYRSLQTIGTDFSVMLQLFPNRSRRDLKLKFKKEEKYNMALINKALLHPKEFNVDELKLQFDKEDEEIELKKQEWADVRKKIHTDRKEQLSISKKRNPSKQISSSMRNLTDGDLIYEHEFVNLPKIRRQKRKRQLSTDTLDECAIKRQSVHGGATILSPVPLNHNNNHVENLPIHTYATHKLPSIIEMLSNRKKSAAPVSYTSQAVPNGIENHKKTSQIERDSSIEPNESDEEKPLRVIDDRQQQYPDGESSGMVAAATAAAEIAENENSGTSNHLILNTETLINRFGDKSPNLSLKAESNDDIMNMDIIFENVPIEEDRSIVVVESQQPSLVTHSPPINEAIASNPSKLHTIDGVQYEIITLNEANQQTSTDNNETNVIDMDEISAATAIGTDASCGVYASNEVVIVDSESLAVAAQIETAQFNRSQGVEDSTNDNNNAEQQHSQSNNIVDDKNFELPNEQLHPKIPCEQNSSTKSQMSDETKEDGPRAGAAENAIVNRSIVERKRKRKPVPVLNKRPRRTNLVERPELQVQNERADAEQLKIERIEEPTASENLEQAALVDVKTIRKVKENGTFDSIEANMEGGIGDAAAEQTSNEKEGDSDENGMNSLVVVESQDPNDLSKTLYEVFVVDPVTKEMSEKPLDLSDDVIQRIRMSM